jgi:hypothetical protein
MKKIILFVAAACILCLQACYKDKGHYDYQPANKVTITMPEEINAYLGEVFTYAPEIAFADPADTTGFEYWWEYMGVYSNLDHREVINEGRTLRFNPEEVGVQDVQLCVKDPRVGVTTTASMKIAVISRYMKGWLILCNEAGESKLSFVRPERNEEGNRVYTPFPDLYGSIYPDDRLGSNPLILCQQVTSSEDVNVYLLQDRSTLLNGTSYFKMIDLEDALAGDLPAGFHPVEITQNNQNRGMIRDASGALLIYSGGRFSNIPMQHAGQTLNVKKIIASREYMTMFSALIEDDRVLWLYTPSAIQSEIMTTIMPSDIVGDYLDFNDLNGVDILYSTFYGESYYSANNITLYAKGGNIHVQQCHVDQSWSDQAFVVSNLNCIEFPGKARVTASTKYFQLRTRNFLFFSGGNELFYYNLLTGDATRFYTFAPGETVVDMDSNPQESELGVALSSGRFVTLDILLEHLTRGTLLYEIDLEGSPVDLEYKYTDLMDFYYRPYGMSDD